MGQARRPRGASGARYFPLPGEPSRHRGAGRGKRAAADVLAECKKVGVNQVVGVNLFDVYRGKGVAEGYKSLAISLILQDTSRTLEEEEIAATVARCVEALKERFQASLRD
ncbi:hypothetical protein LNP17_18500 [Klebsiella variicola subsp. variicola]|nr:hypothetical protein [Klebsiella variicola subsp. variicola]